MKYKKKLICYACGERINDISEGRVEWVKDNCNNKIITEIRLIHKNHSYGYKSPEKLVGDDDLVKLTPTQMYSRLLELKKYCVVDDVILTKLINDLFE